MFKRLLCYGTLVCLFSLAPAVYAQIRSGTITGTVEDQSGAVIADADVVVTETGTNITYPAKTTQAGLYTVPYLATGTYSVSITKTGFESYQATGIHLDSSET